MAVPPKRYITPAETCLIVVRRFDCAERAAENWLADLILAKELVPVWLTTQPTTFNPRVEIDWRHGAVVKPGRRLQTRAITEEGDPGEWTMVPGPTYPFEIDWRELERALNKAAGDDSTEELPTDPPPFEAKRRAGRPSYADEQRDIATRLLSTMPSEGLHDRAKFLAAIRSAGKRYPQEDGWSDTTIKRNVDDLLQAEIDRRRTETPASDII